jgi:hypothetical protein
VLKFLNKVFVGVSDEGHFLDSVVVEVRKHVE